MDFLPKACVFLLIVIIPAIAFAQLDDKTKIYLKVYSACSCYIQLARNDKPAGHPFRMLADTFLFAIEKETTGFFITCGHGRPSYLKVPYLPGEGMLSIYGFMACDSAMENKMSVTPIFD